MSKCCKGACKEDFKKSAKEIKCTPKDEKSCCPPKKDASHCGFGNK